MTVKLLTEQNLEFLSITGGCTGSSGKQRSDVLLGCFVRVWSGSKLFAKVISINTSRHNHFLLSAGSTHSNITEKLSTRSNSLPHIFLHCEMTNMQRVFHGHHNWVAVSNEYVLSVPLTWKACLCFDKIGCDKRISHWILKLGPI